MCSFGDKSFENEVIGDVEAALGVTVEQTPVNSVDVRDLYVQQDG